MTYQDALDFLFNSLPVFQNSGPGAYKPGLENAYALSAAFGNPHKGLRCVHVAGTNGKGSVSHTLAAILMAAGYKTALFTSPHLVDFRERIRINGAMIPREMVIDFTSRYKEMHLDVSPSFFELTTVMAFKWFARECADVAVIETGLGGRLDTTNIISPDLSIITNISFDHTALLGNTLAAIAGEKAGIIKPGAHVVVGNASGDGVREVFERKARECGTRLIFAEESNEIALARHSNDGWDYVTEHFGEIHGELAGDCQRENAATIFEAVKALIRKGYRIDAGHVARGFANVVADTGLMGRWSILRKAPVVVADTGHNTGGWKWLAPQIASLPGVKHLVLGFVSDKDVSAVLKMASEIKSAKFYFTQASVSRAMPACELAAKAAAMGIEGEAYATVAEAYEKALAAAGKGDSVFVGGSTFVVADLVALLSEQR